MAIPKAKINITSPADQERIISEAFNRDQTWVLCEKHPQAEVPVEGCKGCWMSYYIRMFAKVPPSQRRARIEEFYRIVRNMVQEFEAGKWDFEPFPHAKIQIEKGEE